MPAFTIGLIAVIKVFTIPFGGMMGIYVTSGYHLDAS